MKVSEVMTRDVQTIRPDQSARDAASDSRLVDQAIKELANR